MIVWCSLPFFLGPISDPYDFPAHLCCIISELAKWAEPLQCPPPPQHYVDVLPTVRWMGGKVMGSLW